MRSRFARSRNEHSCLHTSIVRQRRWTALVGVSMIAMMYSETFRLTTQGDDYDIYDGPESPAKRLKDNNETWRPWVSQNTGTSGNVIHVSTPDRRTEITDRRESHRAAKQQATPGHRQTYLSLIYDALGAKPDEPSSLEDIIKWIDTNRPATYQEYGAKKLRTAIQTSLTFQAKKVESKRKVWAYSGGLWQLHKAAVTAADDEESVDTYTERQASTPSTLIPSSLGGRTRDCTLESCENTPPSELRQTRERSHANSKTIPPTIVPQVQAESRLASIQSQPSVSSPEAYTQNVNENLASHGVAPSAPSPVGRSLHHEERLTQTEPAAGRIPVTPNNESSNTVESRAPANSCDRPKQDGQDEPDYGQIVRDLHRLKQKRKIQEQKIEANHNSLPDVNTLTQSANEAKRAADEAQRAAVEAQRIANEAQRAAETAEKAVEDAQAKQSQLAADERYLKKLTQDSHILRTQLDID
jgi:hypothetical protein